MSSRSLVYLAFDRFPAPKGAAIHIAAFIEALSDAYSDVDLVTVSDSLSIVENDLHLPNGRTVRHTQLPAVGPSLVERVLSFRTHLRAWWNDRRPGAVHVRSIFEGYHLARTRHRWCDRFVFEVNGLPSIELKYHYPQAADDRELMRKLIVQEQTCLNAADLILTVSHVNAEHLRKRGVNPSRIHVIPNGVDTVKFPYQLPQALVDRELSMLYSGTLASWQGVTTAIDALSLFRREAPARLTIAGSGRPDQSRRLMEFAKNLGVDDSVKIVGAVSQQELARLHHQADVVIVPLMPNDRNLIQGCCPLKLLEAMASGTPVIASDLPVVREIANDGIEALLVKPGSAKSVKDAIQKLRDDSCLAARLSFAARKRIESDFTWKISQRKLIEAYQRML